MRCNYRPPKLTKEEKQDMASLKSTLPYIDRLQIEQRQPRESITEYHLTADEFIENMESRIIDLSDDVENPCTYEHCRFPECNHICGYKGE